MEHINELEKVKMAASYLNHTIGELYESNLPGAYKYYPLMDSLCKILQKISNLQTLSHELLSCR